LTTFNAIYFKEKQWEQYIENKYPVGTAIALGMKRKETGQVTPYTRSLGNGTKRADGHWVNIIKVEKLALNSFKNVVSVDGKKPSKGYQRRLMRLSGLKVKTWKEFTETAINQF